MAFTIATPNSASAWRPDQFAFAPTDAVPDALISTVTTVAGNIEGDEPVLKVAYVDDADADFVAEGATIPEAQPDLSEAIIRTAKISKLLRITSEQYRQASTPAQLAQSAARAVTRRADLALLTEPVTGLINTTGIVDGGAVTASLDALVDLVAVLQVNLAQPTHIVVGPLGWAELRKLKQSATASNMSLLGAGTDDSVPRLLSLPVVVSNAIDDNAGLVIDRNAVVSAVGTVQVATSTDVYFTNDSVGYRITWRIGHTVPRPNRIGKFTVTTT